MKPKRLCITALLLGIICSCSSDSSSKIEQADYLPLNNAPSTGNTAGDNLPNDTAYNTAALVKQYHCNTNTVIYAETELNFAAICQNLAEVELLFFEHFGSIPVTGDNNLNRNLYLYKDRVSYLGVGFNASSYGKYIEKNPNDINSPDEIYSYLLNTGKVKNLSHEYIHYLDGRFNKEGDYHATDVAAWWTEGIAEYLQHLYWHVPSSFIKESISDYGDNFSLTTIFSLTKDDYKTDFFNLVYDGGNVALCYFLQEEPNALKTLLSHSRSGNWSAWSNELTNLDANYGEDFAIFVTDILNNKKFCHGKTGKKV